MEMRPIPGYPGYQVTDDGRLWLERQGRFSRAKPGRYGYTLVSLHPGNGTRRAVRIHDLVLEAFVGSCPDGMECRHLDGNPRNNNLSNLVWGTSTENHRDTVRHGRYHLIALRGEGHPSSKLTTEQVKEIRRDYNPPNVMLKTLAARYGVGTSCIHSVLHGQTWKEAV